MTKLPVPRGVTTAALLKAQLDAGKDYFDLLAPLVARSLPDQAGGIIDPTDVRSRVEASTGLQLDLRTVGVLLERLSRRAGSGVRKDAGVYLCAPRDALTADTHADSLSTEFAALGEQLLIYAGNRLPGVVDSSSALDALCDFLDSNAAHLSIAEGTHVRAAGRKADILIAGFVGKALNDGGPSASSLVSLLQGRVLARAVTLEDLSSLDRKFSNLSVYFDTPFVLMICGLYGDVDSEAARDTVGMLKELGAVPAVFDKTVNEVRRILAVYEDRLDTMEGRQSLDYTPLTRYLFALNATGADVRMRSALLEQKLSREGLAVHETPPRIAEFVEDETALSEALADVRGAGHQSREQHDVDCVAAILTLRRGRRATTLEDARAIFAAYGRVVQSVSKWWSASGRGGIAPVLSHSTIVNSCWLKRPRLQRSVHRHEIAALCAATLMPSASSWTKFRAELKKLVDSGEVPSDEAAVVLIDSLTAKLVVEHEEDDSLGPASVADIIDRVRSHHRAETDSALAMVEKEKEERRAEQIEAERRQAAALADQRTVFESRIGGLEERFSNERDSRVQLEASLRALASRLAKMAATLATAVGLFVVAVVTLFSIFDTSRLSPAMRTSIQFVTFIVAFASTSFGVTATSAGRRLSSWFERRLLRVMVGKADPGDAAP